MALGPFEAYAADLAPGDRGVADADWTGFSIERIDSDSHALFPSVYERLWNEFGERGEMERADVLADRLAWRPGRTNDRTPGHAFSYEMLAVRSGGDIVAVRDHTVILAPPADGEVVVHLSHVLVEPAMRGRGLAAWLRAMPIATARNVCAAWSGKASERGVTLVAEMEPDDGSGDVRRRLRSYARAGFRMVDPLSTDYSQPDFRHPDEIDATSARPVPLCLVVRRVGREHENTIPATGLRTIVDGLYAMFSMHVRPDHMAGVRESLSIPATGEVALVVPGFAPPEDRTVIK